MTTRIRRGSGTDPGDGSPERSRHRARNRGRGEHGRRLDSRHQLATRRARGAARRALGDRGTARARDGAELHPCLAPQAGARARRREADRAARARRVATRRAAGLQPRVTELLVARAARRRSGAGQRRLVSPRSRRRRTAVSTRAPGRRAAGSAATSSRASTSPTRTRRLGRSGTAPSPSSRSRRCANSRATSGGSRSTSSASPTSRRPSGSSACASLDRFRIVDSGPPSRRWARRCSRRDGQEFSTRPQRGPSRVRSAFPLEPASCRRPAAAAADSSRRAAGAAAGPARVIAPAALSSRNTGRAGCPRSPVSRA